MQFDTKPTTFQSQQNHNKYAIDKAPLGAVLSCNELSCASVEQG